MSGIEAFEALSEEERSTLTWAIGILSHPRMAGALALLARTLNPSSAPPSVDAVGPESSGPLPRKVLDPLALTEIERARQHAYEERQNARDRARASVSHHECGVLLPFGKPRQNP